MLIWVLFLALCAHALASGCALGYTRFTGDVAGFGSINGKGNAQSVANCDACAQLCNSEPTCGSYECSPTANRCNLNTAPRPDKNSNNYLDWMFCGSGCATGYTMMDGDVAGYGTINGKGNGQIVTDCSECAQLCNNEPTCGSYECFPNSLGAKGCNLNTATQPDPNTEAFKDSFCAAVSCGQPSLANTAFSPCNSLYKGSCKATCNAGYKGSPSAVCGADGSWTYSGSCVPGCATDYTQLNGDVAGFGSIKGRGNGESVTNCDQCAQLCSAQTICGSYECSPTEKKCNLNTSPQPDSGSMNFQDYLFCSAGLKWVCISSGNSYLPVSRVDEVQCMSTNAKDCLYVSSKAACDAEIANQPQPQKPLQCGAMHKSIYGVTGYDTAGHWCGIGAAVFPKCPTGYTLLDGDVPGFGSINGKGGDQAVTDCDACGQLCDSESSCGSFECSPTERKCNLNTSPKPGTGSENYKDWMFCSAASRSPLPSASPHASPSPLYGYLCSSLNAMAGGDQYQATFKYPQCAYDDWFLPTIVLQSSFAQPIVLGLTFTGPFIASPLDLVLPANGMLEIMVTATMPLGSGASVSGQLMVNHLCSPGSDKKVVSFTAYNLADTSADVEKDSVVIGDNIRVSGTGSAAGSSSLQYLVPANPPVMLAYPAAVQDGWASSMDPNIKHYMAIKTSSLPAMKRDLTVTLRQLVTLSSGETLGRCWDYQVQLFPKPPTCSGSITINPTTAVSGNIIEAQLNTLPTDFQVGDTAQHAWGFDSGSPSEMTDSPTAQLTVPFLPMTARGQTQVTVQATDIYGRQQMCSASLMVKTPDLATAAADSQCANPSQGNLSSCLAICTAMLTDSEDYNKGTILLPKLLKTASMVSLTSVDDTNELLSALADVAASMPAKASNDYIQGLMVDVINNLIATAPLSDDSVDLFVKIAGPMLTTALGDPDYQTGGVPSMRLAMALDAMLKAVSLDSDNPFYEMKQYSYGSCLDVSYGYHTKYTITQGLSGGSFAVPQDAASSLPSNMTVQMIQFSHACNPFRTKLRSNLPYRKFLVYDKASRSLYKGGSSTLWMTSFSMQAQTQSSMMSIQKSKFAVQENSQCIVVDVNNDPATPAYTMNSSTCSSSTVGAMTGSKSVAEPSNNDNGVALGVGIGVGVGVGLLVLISLGLLIWVYLYHRKQEELPEFTFVEKQEMMPPSVFYGSPQLTESYSTPMAYSFSSPMLYT